MGEKAQRFVKIKLENHCHGVVGLVVHWLPTLPEKL